jgi:hypothetical protein
VSIFMDVWTLAEVESFRAEAAIAGEQLRAQDSAVVAGEVLRKHEEAGETSPDDDSPVTFGEHLRS